LNSRTQSLTFSAEIEASNLTIIENYIEARKIETNLSKRFQIVVSNTLRTLSRRINKNFKDMTRDDLVLFLNSIRKSESEDPTHKWIGTYNLYLIITSTFFKWLYYPKTEPKERPRPEILQNLKRLKRRERSTYKPSDMWTQDDDLLFLKYCPSVRDRAYHMIARDTSCRPSEILELRIKDLVFKMTGENRQYAEIVVNGKTGTRAIPLINSIPRIKDLLDSHPQKNNSNAYLIQSESMFGRRISIHALNLVYKKYKEVLFPSLLRDPLLDSDDKAKIKELLKKPWNPYIRRHSALTEKSKILKEHVLRQHAGWSANSNMHQKYIHYLGNESNESILEAYGLINKDKKEIDKLKPRQCPNCNEQNNIDSKFCSKCRMVLSYDEYTQVIKDQEIEKQNEITSLKNQVNENTTTLQKLMELISLQFGWESRFGKDKDETERKKRQLHEDLCKEGVRSAHWFMD
jgi:integrase